MLEKTFSLLVYLKKPKFYKDKDPYQIYLRITVDGVPIELSAKRTWDPLRWNARSGRAIGTKEDARGLNTFIDLLTNKVHEARRILIDANKDITALAIKNCLLGVDDRKTILVIFKDHNKRVEELLDKEYAAGTLDLFERTLEHTRNFIIWKYGMDDLELKKLDHEFIDQYSFWFKTVRNCQHNTTIKYLTYFKKIVLLCVKYGWLTRDPFANFKLTKKEVPKDYLTNDELNKMINKCFVSERLSQVRDIFLFSCYTGLAYADVAKLKRSEIIVGEKNQKWININRQKTDTLSKVPLLAFPIALIEKYKNHPVCEVRGTVLPTLSNQKMNSYLKEITDVCGISKNLTFHIARHTFATTITLNNGVPLESVSKMLGHKSLRQTQHYAKLLDKRVGQDMNNLEVVLSAMQIGQIN